MTLLDNAGTAEELTVFRKELRRRLVEARLSMAPAVRAAAETALRGHLKNLLGRLELTVLGFCWPYRGEFDARPLVCDWINDGGTALLPVPVGEGLPLVFRDWTPDSPLVNGPYDIPIPATGANGHPEILLIPMNGFDAAGYRLGYGGGYFDRTLENLTPRPLAVGVGFEAGRVDSIRPQSYDARLDYVVTEAGAFQVGDEGLVALNVTA